jgi:glycosyltransferase involved in cell wall biosynthesis
MNRILFLTHSLIGDRSFGGAIRANAIRDALLKNGQVDTLIIHGGTEFGLDQQWDERRARNARVSVYGFSQRALAQRRAVRRWIDEIITLGAYDHIIVQYLDLATLVPRDWRSLIIYDPDDFMKTAPAGGVRSLPGRAKIALRNAIALRVARQAGHVWYVNPADRPLPPNDNRSELPNIVGMPSPERPRASVVPGRILMVGHLLHGPNVDGLRWFAANVLSQLNAARSEVQLHVIGRHAQDLPAQLPQVIFHGYVDDIGIEYDKAGVVIAPVLSGAGTQIKVIDALAHGRPLITSSFAYSGFAECLRDREHLLVARSAEDWSQLVIWALIHQREAELMAQAGEEVVSKKFGQHRMDQGVSETLQAFSSRRPR